LGVALPGDNGPQDLQPGHAGDVGQDVMELQVHLLQGFLHMQDVRGAVLNEFSPMTQVSPQRDHLGIGPEGAGQQAQTVQLL
jgi:hypothetical protein